MRSRRSDFREDRDNNFDIPERDERPRWPYKRRTFPQHPRGEYVKLLDEMISQARAKREAQLPPERAA
jgi:hypothetical protein